MSVALMTSANRPWGGDPQEACVCVAGEAPYKGVMVGEVAREVCVRRLCVAPPLTPSPAGTRRRLSGPATRVTDCASFVTEPLLLLSSNTAPPLSASLHPTAAKSTHRPWMSGGPRAARPRGD